MIIKIKKMHFFYVKNKKIKKTLSGIFIFALFSIKNLTISK
jgi:hypothetical protein